MKYRTVNFFNYTFQKQNKSPFNGFSWSIETNWRFYRKRHVRFPSIFVRKHRNRTDRATLFTIINSTDFWSGSVTPIYIAKYV